MSTIDLAYSARVIGGAPLAVAGQSLGDATQVARPGGGSAEASLAEHDAELAAHATELDTHDRGLAAHAAELDAHAAALAGDATELAAHDRSLTAHAIELANHDVKLADVVSLPARGRAAWAIRDRASGRMFLWLDRLGRFAIGNLTDIAGRIVDLDTRAPVHVPGLRRRYAVTIGQDTSGRVPVGITPRGRLEYHGVDVDPAIGRVRGTAPRGRYAVAFGQDSAGRVPLGITRAGRAEYHGRDVHDLLMGDASAASWRLVPQPNIVGYGDSLTEGAGSSAPPAHTWWTVLGQLLAARGDQRLVQGYGYGGQAAASILARQGGAPTLLGFPADAAGYPTIPAVGAVNVTDGAGSLSYADPSQDKSITGSVAGVHGTLRKAGGTLQYSFTRDLAGDPVRVDAGVPFLPDTGGREFWTQVCWIATNDTIPGTGNADTIIAQMIAYEAFQRSSEKRTIFLTPLFNNSYSGGQLAGAQACEAAVWAKAQARWPRNTIRTLALLQRHASNSADDIADVAAGLVPRSLLCPDRLHLNDAGYAIVAAAILALLLQLGY